MAGDCPPPCLNTTNRKINIMQTIYLTESEALSQYDDMLDDCYPMAEICGYQYQPSRAFRELDPIAYRVGFSDYCSSLSEDGYEIDYN